MPTTTWFDLPFEMKREIFQYLSVEDRFKFAEASSRIAMDVIEFERNWTDIRFEKTKDGYDLKISVRQSFLTYIDDFFQSTRVFEVEIEVRKSQIVWKLSKKVIRKESVKSKNVRDIAYDQFESMLRKSKNSLKKLAMTKIDITFREALIKIFPKLEEINIVTNNEKTLYWLLPKSPNIKKMTISFRKSPYFKEIPMRKVMDSEKFVLEKLVDLKVETNWKKIAEDIVSRSANLSTLKFKFNCYDTPKSNEILVEMLKSSNVKTLEFFFCLDDQQFIDLVKTCNRVKCTEGAITYECINILIEHLLDNVIERNFCICYVDEAIIESNYLKLKLCPNRPSWNRQRSTVVYKDCRSRSRRLNFIVGELRYFKETRFLTFNNNRYVVGSFLPRF